MIDLSQMKSIRVDPMQRRAWAEPGCTLADLDHETQAYGLAVPTGINSTTGVAGLTLGGGYGWLSRKYGLTADNLVSADVVTADGVLRHASDQVSGDLLWAIRGGGGNFGVVTSFEYRLHPVGPMVLAGLIVHPGADAPRVLRFYRDFVANQPDELTVWTVLRQAPPLPFLPPEWHGKNVVVLAVCHLGEIAAGERLIEPLRKFGNPIADVVGPMELKQWQQAFDPLLTPGARNYWKSHNFDSLADGVLDRLVEDAGRLPTPQCEIFLGQIGGAMARVSPTATAYPHRGASFTLNVHTRWESAADDARCIAWARACFEALAPFATGGVYVNFMPADETDRVPAAYGPNYARLLELKARYDPSNLFRMNQNIRPPEGRRDVAPLLAQPL
jgi:FAD/FMN-containing dehydrogenase